ncbi:MAG: hypothetical protein ABIQ36_07400 [Rhodanobacter sp.]
MNSVCSINLKALATAILFWPLDQPHRLEREFERVEARVAFVSRSAGVDRTHGSARGQGAAIEAATTDALIESTFSNGNWLLKTRREFA